MKFIDAVNKVRSSRFYRCMLYLCPPLYLLELWLWMQAVLLILTLIPFGFLMIPQFPIVKDCKESKKG